MMGKDKKTMINEGWAISQEKMLKKLSNYAKEGWILDKMTMLKFHMLKGEPQELYYGMDFQETLEDEKEYLRLFEEDGWEFICGDEGFRVVATKDKHKKLHTDRTLLKETRDKEKKRALIMLLVSFTMVILSLVTLNFLGKYIIVKVLSFLIGVLFGGVFGMSIVLVYGYYFREGK